MGNISIKNAKIILDSEILEGDLNISNGRILDFAKHLEPLEDAQVIDAKGSYLSPAFIEIHCHGTCGADFSSGKIEDFEIIAKQKLAEGVSHIFPTSLCMSLENLKAFMKTARDYAATNKYAKVEAVHLEGSFIAKEMCGAQNANHCRKCDISEIDELSKIFKIAKVSYSLEADDTSGDFAKALIQRGIVPSCAHSNASFKDFEKAHYLGLKNITHFFNRCSGFSHKDIGIVGAGLYFEDVYLELILDLVHVDKKALELVLKAKDYSKIVAITDSILLANMPEGTYDMAGVKVSLQGNTAKIAGTQNLAGSVVKMNEMLKNLVEDLNVPLLDAVKMLSQSPAQSLNLQGNSIKKDSSASLTIFNKEFHVELCIVDGVIKYKKDR